MIPFDGITDNAENKNKDSDDIFSIGRKNRFQNRVSD